MSESSTDPVPQYFYHSSLETGFSFCQKPNQGENAVLGQWGRLNQGENAVLGKWGRLNEILKVSYS